jgi:hypothetical protein
MLKNLALASLETIFFKECMGPRNSKRANILEERLRLINITLSKVLPLQLANKWLPLPFALNFQLQVTTTIW